MRALWDYYKVDGVITTQYELKRKVTPTGSEREGPGEASFSMLKLQQIAKERDMFSSIESFTSEDDESDEEDEDPEKQPKLKVCGIKHNAGRHFLHVMSFKQCWIINPFLGIYQKFSYLYIGLDLRETALHKNLEELQLNQ